MNMVFNKNICRLSVAFLAVLVLLSSLSGCKVFDEIIESQTDTTEQSTTVKETAPTNNTGKTLYGFDNITDESVKIFYGMIDEYADRAEEEFFTVDRELSLRQLCEGISAYKEDHPEVFWLNNNCIFYYNSGNTCVSLKFLMDYETRVNAKSEIDKRINEIVSNAPSGATQFELELYAHDYIIDNCEYDYDWASSQASDDNTGNVYGALIEGKAVCEGYSRAFQLICKKLGLECVNIFGVSDEEYHMWNCIMIDGQWYQVDVTWDDADGEQKDIASYMFFNLNDDNMYMDHQVSGMYENISDEEFEDSLSNANLFVPQCTANEYNYHLYYGALITDIENSDDIVSAIAQAAKDGRDIFYLTADSSLDYDDLSSKLIEGGYIADWINSANIKNFYSPNLNAETEVYCVNQYNLFILKLQYI